MFELFILILISFSSRYLFPNRSFGYKQTQPLVYGFMIEPTMTQRVLDVANVTGMYLMFIVSPPSLLLIIHLLCFSLSSMKPTDVFHDTFIALKLLPQRTVMVGDFLDMTKEEQIKHG